MPSSCIYNIKLKIIQKFQQDEKLTTIPNNLVPFQYYNEYNGHSLYHRKIQYLGINYNGNLPLMSFRLQNGKIIIRQLRNCLRYEPFS